MVLDTDTSYHFLHLWLTVSALQSPRTDESKIDTMKVDKAKESKDYSLNKWWESNPNLRRLQAITGWLTKSLRHMGRTPNCIIEWKAHWFTFCCDWITILMRARNEARTFLDITCILFKLFRILFITFGYCYTFFILLSAILKKYSCFLLSVHQIIF